MKCQQQTNALMILVAATVFLVSTENSVARPDRWKMEGWANTDFTKTSVDFGEILSGGPPKDGIPSIDTPKFRRVADETSTADQAPVVGLTINGEARAYPLSVLMWHEIVNDTVGGRPVTVTYCPLCNAAIVFDRGLNGQLLDFGTTGKLRNSDLIMYDRQTQTWWQQFTGEAIVGALLGRELEIVPSRLESWLEFRGRNPKGRILIPNNPKMRAYGRNPYVGYDTAARPFLYSGDLPKNINPMARVVVVRQNSDIEATSLEVLRKKKTMKLGSVTLRWQAGQSSALDAGAIAEGRDVGTITAQRTDRIGRWRDVAYDVTFAFVVYAFHPKLRIVTD
ncbi:MAG: DUF3179 domain-containing protein [Hyphomicrobiaceae bacterium]